MNSDGVVRYEFLGKPFGFKLGKQTGINHLTYRYADFTGVEQSDF
jgi:hypothetical protein